MDLYSNLISTALVLLIIIDPFGNVPILMSVLRSVPEAVRRRVIFRELVVGLAILLLFLFFGRAFLDLFHLQTEAVTIAGGVILFIIALRLIFPTKGQSVYGGEGEPFVVPIAMPMIAGPSALATLMVIGQGAQGALWMPALSVLLAWSVALCTFMSAPWLFRVLKEKGLQALERLMGMILLIMAVQQFINGLSALIKSGTFLP